MVEIDMEIQMERHPPGILCLFVFFLLFISTSTSFGEKTLYKIKTMKDLESVSRDIVRNQIVKEANRALAVIELKHGNRNYTKAGTEEVMTRLQSEGYLSSWFAMENDWSHIEWEKNRLISRANYSTVTKSGKVPTIGNIAIMRSLLRKALSSKNHYLHYLSLSYIAEKDNCSRELIHWLINGYIRAYDTPLTVSYLNVLRLPSSVKAARDKKALSDRVIRSLRKLARKAHTKEQKMEMLFLLVWYCRLSPGASFETVSNQIEADYPLPYLIRLLKEQPVSRIELLALHITAGYGTRQDTLLRLAAEFPDNLKCLRALAMALVNKGHKDFERNAGLIIHLWEELTGMTWLGDDGPFVSWYHKRREAFEGK